VEHTPARSKDGPAPLPGGVGLAALCAMSPTPKLSYAASKGSTMRRCNFITLLGSAATWQLAACAPAAMGPFTVFADPGQYDYLSCELLATRHKYWAERELELKLLMDRAEQSAGGSVVNVIAYQGDYTAAREELRVIDATRRVKKCDV
jgi:hypothetical protein